MKRWIEYVHKDSDELFQNQLLWYVILEDEINREKEDLLLKEENENQLREEYSLVSNHDE